MSILVDGTTRVLVQGITCREGQFHSQLMIEFGTKLVGGVVPGKGGKSTLAVPIFDTVADAVAETDANATVIFVPAAHAAAAIIEAAEAEVPLIICITEGIPVQDMIRAADVVKEKNVRLIGPNCPGVTSPFKSKLGIMPKTIFAEGRIGVISRSGTLTYEIVNELTRAGLGQSTCIGIGGDPILGSTFVDLLPLFDDDPGTDAVVMIGEIGGSDEEEAAELISTLSKPVIGFISGRTAPAGKRMGHAGAIISGGKGTAESKMDALKAAGVPVADTPFEIVNLVKVAVETSKDRSKYRRWLATSGGR